MQRNVGAVAAGREVWGKRAADFGCVSPIPKRESVDNRATHLPSRIWPDFAYAAKLLMSMTFAARS